MQPGEIGSSRTRGFAAIGGMSVIANLDNPAGSPVYKRPLWGMKTSSRAADRMPAV